MIRSAVDSLAEFAARGAGAVRQFRDRALPRRRQSLYASTLPRFTGFRYGTGMGVRYYTSFGPIRLDVGTPINPQRGDGRVAVYVSLGQAF